MTASPAVRRHFDEWLTDSACSEPEATQPLPDRGTLTGAVATVHQLRYEPPRGGFIVTVEGNASWLLPTAKALCELLALPADWDSYGALPVKPSRVFAALELLLGIMGDDSPKPSVVPTSRGGVQLEWHMGGIDLEIEVLSSLRFHVAFEDSASGEEWEREIGSDLSPLASCIARLSRSA